MADINNTNNTGQNADEISLKNILLKVKKSTNYFKSKWLLILIVGIAGAILGFAYAIFKKPLYTATSTFVLDEGSSHGGLGQYANLASLAGVNIGGSGGGLFQGDNIIALYTSRAMLEKALLDTAMFNGKKSSLIERYISFNKLRKQWKEKDHIDSITFNGKPENFNRKQDSLITDITTLFNKKLLVVSKPDKKSSIIEVDVISGDELFAKCFNDKLVETVNNFYIQTKTKKSLQNVQLLQRQADSVKAMLNSSISGVASAAESSPNANPFMLSLKVPSQKKQIDVQSSAEIYSGIVQNLELAKVTLLQETPLIQVIDGPLLPLPVAKIGKIKGLILGGILGLFAVIAYLSIKRLWAFVTR